MSKFVVHFEMDIEVDMPNISAKEGELVYKEGGKQTISDDQWNEIVSEAVYYAEDIENNVTAIQYWIAVTCDCNPVHRGRVRLRS